MASSLIDIDEVDQKLLNRDCGSVEGEDREQHEDTAGRLPAGRGCNAELTAHAGTRRPTRGSRTEAFSSRCCTLNAPYTTKGQTEELDLTLYLLVGMTGFKPATP